MPCPDLQQSKCSLVFGLCVYTYVVMSFMFCYFLNIFEWITWVKKKMFDEQIDLGWINQSLLIAENYILEKFCED